MNLIPTTPAEPIPSCSCGNPATWVAPVTGETFCNPCAKPHLTPRHVPTTTPAERAFAAMQAATGYRA